MEILPLDGAEGRRLSPTDAQQLSRISQLQSNSNDVDLEVDHAARAWESTTKAASIFWECLKSRALVPVLRWALSALGALPVRYPDEEGDIALRLAQLTNLVSSLDAVKEEHENMRLRCLLLEGTLIEEKKKRENMIIPSGEHESTRLRCLQLERSLKDANDKQTQLKILRDAEVEKVEKMKKRCEQLEDRLAMVQSVIAKAEKIVGVTKQGDEKLLREIEALRAQGFVR